MVTLNSHGNLNMTQSRKYNEHVQMVVDKQMNEIISNILTNYLKSTDDLEDKLETEEVSEFDDRDMFRQSLGNTQLYR